MKQRNYERLKGSGFTDSEILHITGWKKGDLPRKDRTRAGWTEKEDRYLRENGPYKTNTKLGKALGRSAGAVSARLTKLGIKKGYKQAVSKEGEDYIRKNYKHMLDSQIAEKIGCKTKQVAYIRRKMGLFKR